MLETVTAQTLNEQFGVPHTLRFEDDPHGLTRAVITAEAATAVLYLHGAHLTEYQPTGQRPLLFTSRQSQFQHSRPIRGGVPICFPWFGPNQSDPDAPMHGLARTQPWQLVNVEQQNGQRLRLTLNFTATPFQATYHVTVGPELELRLRVQNNAARATAPARFEQALHTYLAVSQIRSVAIDGLAGMTYLDKTRGGDRHTQDSQPVRFDGETDRIYINHPDNCILHDPGWARHVVVEKENANSTIVWNPWIGKASRLPDLGDDEWPDFACIESGNVADNAVSLAPDEAHEMATSLRVQDL